MMSSKSASATVTAGLTTLTVLAALAGGGGCGLISSDITSVKFDLPEQYFTFDTAWVGTTFPATTLPSIQCPDPRTAEACCSAAMVASPEVNCGNVICDEPSDTCALTRVIESPPQMIDLKRQVSALSGYSSQSVIDVTISKISYDITQNTLNVDLPAVELYVASKDATSPSDKSAKLFGTVPPTEHGKTLTDGTVALDPQGQEAFKGFAHNFGTPFVFMARTKVVVPGGTPLPMGALSLTIKGQLRANAGL
jgi:hypothetical protein